MGNKAGCLNAFFVFGLLALAFAVAYKVVFFASYLYLEPYEVDLDCNGGEKDILVHTDAYSWIIEDYYYPSWVTVQKYGSSLLKITVNKNDSKEDRYCDVDIRSGYFGEMGNRMNNLRILQKGKPNETADLSQKSYANPEKFETFWKSFCNDSIFQKSRVKFPLPYIYYEFEYEEDDEGSTEITNYIKANDWKYDKIYDYTDSIEIKQQKEGEYSVVQYGKEPFIIIENIFKRYNGEWYLVKTYDYSD